MRLRRGFFPWVFYGTASRFLTEVLREQIDHYRADVILNLSMTHHAWLPRFWQEVKARTPVVLCGQHAATELQPDEDWTVYDLVISSFPPTVRWLLERGVRTEMIRLGFDPSALCVGEGSRRDVSVSFVGSFLNIHRGRTRFLDELAATVPLTIWGEPPNEGFSDSRLAKCWAGRAWGVDMYRVLRRSRITLNHHGDVAPFANNMRLYEATGMGALLITDWKPDLHLIFEVGKEVVAYRNAKECRDLIDHYLRHDDEGEAIAKAGQIRVLRDHTYHHRLKQLLHLLCETHL
jgi:spore maturation protein CgeB